MPKQRIVIGRAKFPEISLKEILRIVDYNPKTGVFIWKTRNDVPPKWNSRWAGKVAGCNRHDYVVIGFGYKTYLAHRLAWWIMTKKKPGHEIDHIDGNKINNAFSNLREATTAQNAHNSKIKITNKSGFKGVVVDRGYYRAKIFKNGKHHWLGTFESPEEAHAAYTEAAKNFFGKFARFK